MSCSNVVFVGGVKACFNQQEIGDYFSQYGEITSIKMKKSRKSKTINRGFCLIKFTKAICANRVIEIKTHNIMGRLVTCREYLKGDELKVGKMDKHSKTIYISGLHPDTVNLDIIKTFSVFGEVESGYTLNQ
jgi:RNA recognition motif. (a.k.a. RRM, RBD, or RNP domain)